MHIPASMLQGAVCPVTTAVSVAGVAAAVHFSRGQQGKPSAAKFAAVTSMIFALQMLNFTVQNGTSGHLLGGVLAAAFLGVPFAVLSMFIVLTVQAVFFGDGGVNALGANVLNMALIGAAGAGLFRSFLERKGFHGMAAIAVASWVSVVLGAFACSLELAVAGTVGFIKVVPAMFVVHALIGLGEALFTLVLVIGSTWVFRSWRSREIAVASGAFGIAVIATMFSPFASSFPDGLESVAERLLFFQSDVSSWAGLFPDYQVSTVSDPWLATVLAGIAGVAIVGALTFAVGKRIVRD